MGARVRLVAAGGCPGAGLCGSLGQELAAECRLCVAAGYSDTCGIFTFS